MKSSHFLRVSSIILSLILSLLTVACTTTKEVKNPPEIMATPEEDIPTIKVKKTSAWTWVILLGLVGGGAAALAGGGGGGKSGGGSDSGTVTVSW